MLVVNSFIRIPETEFELSFARSSGPGGQNVNKVSSKVYLRWDVTRSPSLSEDVRRRFLQAYATRITNDGFLVISSDRTRDQNKNIEDCYQKLSELLLKVATPPKVRRATKPTRSSQLRRLEAKKARGDRKRGRAKIDY